MKRLQVVGRKLAAKDVSCRVDWPGPSGMAAKLGECSREKLSPKLVEAGDAIVEVNSSSSDSSRQEFPESEQRLWGPPAATGVSASGGRPPAPKGMSDSVSFNKFLRHLISSIVHVKVIYHRKKNDYAHLSYATITLAPLFLQLIYHKH